MSMGRVCAGIVTYNPDIKRLSDNIHSIIDQVEHIVICDNASGNIGLISEAAESNDKISLIKNDKNCGIAYALNRIFEFAYERNYKWLLSLDQDSVSPDEMIRKMMEFVSEKTGIISPLFRDPKIDYGTEIEKGSGECVSVQQCITSGSLTKLEAWKAADGFDEIMFIDFVDFDFCCRVRKAGYCILQISSVVLDHTIGKAEERIILGRKFILTNHSNMRKYYIARNYVYYTKKNGINDRSQRIAMRNKVMKTILLEKDRVGSMKAFIRGWSDGNRMIGGKEPKGWTN